jgi:hypothetical protein
VAEELDVAKLPRRSAEEFVMFGAQISGESSRKLGKTAEEGKLRVVVDSVYKMEDALKVSRATEQACWC